MILCDMYRGKPDAAWEVGRQLGVKVGDLFLPEDQEFDITDISHWKTICNRLNGYGIVPKLIEPMPNYLHNHIKAGDDLRDKSIEKVIKMFSIMDALDIRTICFNWMAYVGWTRTSKNLPERGGALVTGFNSADYIPTCDSISAEALWTNYEYFIKAVIPEAEKHNINLALHPDDPPVANLGDVSRIMINYKNIDHAVNGIVHSPNLGLTFCQANFHTMGENVYELIPQVADKIMFVHFRNVTGTKENFRETFHDNGELNMARLIKIYRDCHVEVPVRVDHVPTMPGEQSSIAGYDAVGRYYAIGYLRGLLEASMLG